LGLWNGGAEKRYVDRGEVNLHLRSVETSHLLVRKQDFVKIGVNLNGFSSEIGQPTSSACDGVGNDWRDVHQCDADPLGRCDAAGSVLLFAPGVLAIGWICGGRKNAKLVDLSV